jgi:hypothetical protein
MYLRDPDEFTSMRLLLEDRADDGVTGLLSPNANVGNKVRSGTTKDIEVDTNLLEKGEIRLRQWIDDRNGVRLQENVRLSLYPQVERSGYV